MLSTYVAFNIFPTNITTWHSLCISKRSRLFLEDDDSSAKYFINR